MLGKRVSKARNRILVLSKTAPGASIFVKRPYQPSDIPVQKGCMRTLRTVKTVSLKLLTLVHTAINGPREGAEHRDSRDRCGAQERERERETEEAM